MQMQTAKWSLVMIAKDKPKKTKESKTNFTNESLYHAMSAISNPCTQTNLLPFCDA